MEGRCESDCGGDEVYPATFGNEEETGFKLDDDDVLGNDFVILVLKNALRIQWRYTA